MFILQVEGPHGVQGLLEGLAYRLLPNTPDRERVVRIVKTPFVIGRAEDCHLVLPEDAMLRTMTSRWHCYLMEQNGTVLAIDGSPQAMPETGQRKPSVTGTLVNGHRIAEPTALQNGDLLQVGKWQFRFHRVKTGPVEASDLLRDVTKGQARRVDSTDPRLEEKFGRLHELVQRLAQIPGIEESLTTLCLPSNFGRHLSLF